MRFLQLCMWCVLALLSACGGGGGSPGVPAGSASPSNFIVNAPAELTLPVGQAVTYSINGGKSPYIATTSVPDVAKVLINGSELLIAALKTGTTSAVITPTGGGAAYTIAITVVDNFQPLQIQSPDTIQLIPSNVVDYPIVGGVAPYRAQVANVNIATASVQGNTIRVQALAIGTTAIQVFDAVNNKIEKTVNVLDAVGPDLFTTAPADLTLPPASNRTFSVSGGLPPYTASSSNTSVMTASVTGNVLTITSYAEGTTSLIVKDAAGKSVTIAGTVSVGAVGPLFTNAPANLTLLPSAGSRDFSIGGGRAPYSVQSSNSSSVRASVAGSTLTLTPGLEGSATVAITDARGERVSITVTVSNASSIPLFTTAPAVLNMVPGAANTRDFSIGGGTAPYSVQSSNPSAVRATVVGSTLTLAPIADGAATIVITDTAGGRQLFNVTVSSSSIVALFTTAPTSLNMAPGAANARDFSVGGGTAPYSVQSSNAAAVRASITGSILTLTPLADGNATVVITDNAGNRVSVVVTVSSGPVVALFTTAPASVNMAPGAANARDFSIGGGTAPYSAQSNNTAVVRITLVNATLTLTPVADGNATIEITDKAGGRVTFAVTVSSGPAVALFTTAPASLNMVPGAANARDFSIGGGRAPYSVQSSNSTAVRATVTGSTLTVTPLTDGTATIAITDNAGARITFVVTASTGPVVALFSTAPSSLSIAPGSTLTFAIGGGLAPYVATSSNQQVVTATANGTQLTLTSPTGATGTANVVITDAGGGRLTIAVTASSAATTTLSLSATNLTLPVNIPATVRIIGGAPPYTVTSAIPSAIAVSPATLALAGEFTLTPLLASTLDITVVDAAGASAKVNVTVNAGTPGIRIAPSALTISETFANQTINLALIGQSAGNYTIFSSDVSRIQVVTATRADGVVELRTSAAAALAVGADIPITITVIDSQNRVATSVITVKDNN